ncbi:MAG: GDP-L-fucose synthase [Spirochaetales bacterium]|nr:GDP-L-fucose synthase [Spirochaetales bacterium]
MEKNEKIFIAGHRGLTGSAIMRKLKNLGYNNLIVRTREELDLRCQAEVEDFFQKEKPVYVFLAAAKVGGILSNSTYVAEFIYDNIIIATNVIHASYKAGVKKLLNLGSSCIYPKFAPQPLKEDSLLTGKLEPTNEPYAIAKIAAIKLCRYYNEQYGTNFISGMPANLYGINDNFDVTNSHVLPALIHKIHEAKHHGTDVTLWGDGSPKREFLYVDDLADALIFIMQNFSFKDTGEFINIGTGTDITIRDLAGLIGSIVGFNGTIHWDTSKPNGTPRKLLDISSLKKLGWQSSTSLKQGIRKVYNWYTSILQKSNNI